MDTSSLIEIRRFVQVVDRPAVFRSLDKLVADGDLSYPKEVVNELRRAVDLKHPDPILDWALRNEKAAVHLPMDPAHVKELLADGTVRLVLDPEKDGVEEADPYVLSLAVRLSRSRPVRVVTEERTDRPRKLSLASVTGVLGLSAVNLGAFLQVNGIWTLPERR